MQITHVAYAMSISIRLSQAECVTFYQKTRPRSMTPFESPECHAPVRAQYSPLYAVCRCKFQHASPTTSMAMLNSLGLPLRPGAQCNCLYIAPDMHCLPSQPVSSDTASIQPVSASMHAGQPDCQFYTKHMRCGFGPSCKCAHHCVFTGSGCDRFVACRSSC